MEEGGRCLDSVDYILKHITISSIKRECLFWRYPQNLFHLSGCKEYLLSPCFLLSLNDTEALNLWYLNCRLSFSLRMNPSDVSDLPTFSPGATARLRLWPWGEFFRSDSPLNFAPHISRVPVSKLHPSSTNTRLSIVVFWHIALDEKCWINMFRQSG